MKILSTNEEKIGFIVILTVILTGGTWLSSSDFKGMIENNPDANYIIVDNLWYQSNKEQIHIITPFEDTYSRWRLTKEK